MDDMARGYSIHIGLDHVDTSSPDYADVTVPVLAGCLNEANSMEALAQGAGLPGGRQAPSYTVSGHSDPAFEEQCPFTV